MSPLGPWMTGVPGEGHTADLSVEDKQGKYQKKWTSADQKS